MKNSTFVEREDLHRVLRQLVDLGFYSGRRCEDETVEELIELGNFKYIEEFLWMAINNKNVGNSEYITL